MESHTQEREIKSEQHHIPPKLPSDPDQLEHEKRQMARLVPAVVLIVAAIFIAVALVVIL